MKRRFEIFVDTESLSENSLNAPVVDVSAMIVDVEKMVSDEPYTMRDLARVKYFKLNTTEQIEKHGAIISENTIKFWKSQPKDVRARVKPREGDLSVKEFVKEFRGFLGTEPMIGRAWSRNIAFDFILLKRMYMIAGENIDDDIEHYLVRDIRTALDVSMGFAEGTNLNFCPVTDTEFWNKVFQPHNSSWDVIADVLRYQAILRNDKDLEQIKR